MRNQLFQAIVWLLQLHIWGVIITCTSTYVCTCVGTPNIFSNEAWEPFIFILYYVYVEYMYAYGVL